MSENQKDFAHSPTTHSPTTYGTRTKPSGGVELTAWIFMRFSGLLLLFLALGHLFIMHVFNSIHVIDYDFVAARYLNLFWRGYDLVMLWLALIHGLNGLRTILDDYLKGNARRMAVRIFYVVGIFFLVIGTYAIIAFQPQTAVPGTPSVPGTVVSGVR